MTIAQMQAHRAVLADLLADTEASYANLSGLFAGAFPATETHLDARRAALRWALRLAHDRIFDETLDQIDEHDPAFQAKIHAALQEPVTRTLTNE